MIGYTCGNCQEPLTIPPNVCVDQSTEGLTTGLHIQAASNFRSEALRSAFLTAAADHVGVLALPTEWVRAACRGTCAPDIRRSDHASFWDNGYPAIVLWDTGPAETPTITKLLM